MFDSDRIYLMENKMEEGQDHYNNEISQEQLRELKMMFDYFDTDHSG